MITDIINVVDTLSEAKDVEREVIFEAIENALESTTKKKYTPDFPIKKSFIVEAKGLFNSKDRKKHRLIKEQHPNYDIRFVFSNSKTKIGKKSKTTYAKWCELFGFKYHCVQSTKSTFPNEWLTEIRKKQNGKTRN